MTETWIQQLSHVLLSCLTLHLYEYLQFSSTIPQMPLHLNTTRMTKGDELEMKDSLRTSVSLKDGIYPAVVKTSWEDSLVHLAGLTWILIENVFSVWLSWFRGQRGWGIVNREGIRELITREISPAFVLTFVRTKLALNAHRQDLI